MVRSDEFLLFFYPRVDFFRTDFSVVFVAKGFLPGCFGVLNPGDDRKQNRLVFLFHELLLDDSG
ncbi:MAG: hypothetical protein CMJ95_08445 [Planctomycetes bacterium]|nr:hypothetical protein [Planctomycetota bacterium]